MITISVLKITLFREIHSYYKCRPPTLSELTPIIFHMKLTHLGSEASICIKLNFASFIATEKNPNLLKIFKKEI